MKMKITADKEIMEILLKQLSLHQPEITPKGNFFCSNVCEEFWPCSTYTRTRQVIALTDIS